jgi:hypothetical protein
MARRRQKNPRVVAVAYSRALKTSAEMLTHVMTSKTTRDVYIRSEDRTPEDVAASRWHRPRRPDEHGDTDPGTWREARRRLIQANGELISADILIRYQMARLGMDSRGVHVGREEALNRLSTADLVFLAETLGPDLR